MIWCVSLNPALDVSYRFAGAILPGSINLAQEMDAQLGGKGNNVARIVQALGQPVTAVAILGGAVGGALLAQAKSFGIPLLPRFVADNSRVCLTLVSENRTVTEVRPPGPHTTVDVADKLLADLLDKASENDWVTISGSLPPGLGDDTYAKWVSALRRRVAGVIVDSSGPVLRKAALAGPTAITPNQLEYEGIRCDIPGGLVDVVVTNGAEGAAWYPNKGRARRWRAPLISSVVNTVGAGDAFLGGLVAGLAQGQAWGDALPEAIAVASASVETLAVATFIPERVRELRRQVKEEDEP